MSKRIVRISILLLLSCLPEAAFSFNCLDCGTKNQASDVTKIAVIDEDGRMTEEEYAKRRGKTLDEVRDRFAATGVLTCASSSGSAQLTGKSDVISTSAHLFTNAETCKVVNGTSSCTFVVKSSAGEQRVKLFAILETGFKCPRIPDVKDDWAIIKLKSPITGIEPYRIPKVWERLERNDKILSVSGLAMDFYKKSFTDQRIYPKAIDECEIREIYAAGWFESDCDVGPGASGGSILKSSAKGDMLMAINKGNSTIPAEHAKELRGLVVRKPYKESEWFSRHVSVTGDFQDALERILGN